jgi:hypothetical protein
MALLPCVAFFNGCGASHSNPSTSASADSSTSLSVSATLPPASVGATYSATLAVTGGTAPYTFLTASGTLPQGVALGESTGTISGTPADSGTFNFAVSVSDSKGSSKQQPLQMTVSNATSAAITLIPATITVTSGATAQFKAQAGNVANTAVTWTASQGSISSTGLFSAPEINSSTTATITAASVADPSQTATATVTVNPSSGQPSAPPAAAGTPLSNLQHSGGWGQFGQGPPKFIDCSPSPCDGISFSMNQGVSSPSLSGHATEYNVGGSTPFSDGLWNNHLIGPDSTQGMPDPNQSIVPSLHTFTYDVYFYGDDLSLSQALEFDINQFFGNMGFIFGHECRIAGGNEWDVWDNQTAHWTPTGIPCYPKSNAWNHVTIKVQRTSNNELTYQSITLNGMTKTLNWTFPHGSAPGWYGLTINYQMDGNSRQDPYNVYLDNLTFTYE